MFKKIKKYFKDREADSIKIYHQLIRMNDKVDRMDNMCKSDLKSFRDTLDRIEKSMYVINKEEVITKKTSKKITP